MARHTQRSGYLFFPLILLVVAGIAGFLVMMGTRLDTAPAEPEKPSASEEIRQDFAQLLSRISDAGAKLSTGTGDVYGMISHDADTWLSAVGGVWVAWPDGAPSGKANAPVETTAPEGIDATGLSQLLLDAGNLGAKAAQADPDHRETFLMIALQARIDARKIGATEVCGEYKLPEVAKAAASERAVVAAEDARQWLETAAAQEGNAAQSASRIEQISTLQSLMISEGVKDTRAGLSPAPTGQPRTAAADLLSAALIDSVGEGEEEQAQVLAYACSLY